MFLWSDGSSNTHDTNRLKWRTFLTREALWYQHLCHCWRLPLMVLVALSDTYNSVYLKRTKIILVTLSSTPVYVNIWLLHGSNCMTESPAMCLLLLQSKTPVTRGNGQIATHHCHYWGNKIFQFWLSLSASLNEHCRNQVGLQWPPHTLRQVHLQCMHTNPGICDYSQETE